MSSRKSMIWVSFEKSRLEAFKAEAESSLISGMGIDVSILLEFGEECKLVKSVLVSTLSITLPYVLKCKECLHCEKKAANHSEGECIKKKETMRFEGWIGLNCIFVQCLRY